MSIPKGTKSIKERGNLINEKVSSISKKSLLQLANISQNKKEMCVAIGINYSTGNFRKIHHRLKILGIDNVLQKFKTKRKEISKAEIILQLDKIPQDVIIQKYDEAQSLIDMCHLLGLNGKNKIIYYLVKNKVQSIGLNITKFKVRTYNTENVKDILTDKNTFRGHSVSAIIKRFEILPNKCNECGINEWNGVPLMLELHHINGNNKDQRIENLMLLCPNCHSLTPNHRNKKR